jgi:hypothetical protein
MANKKITFELDINGKPIDVVIDKTLNLKQAARALTQELNRTKEGTKEFELLSTAMGDVSDKIATTNAKSRDLFASFSLIPGPIGEIAGKINGAIGLMKTFSSFSLKDLKFQLTETIGDFKDIAGNLGKATGITKIYTTLNQALSKSFVAVGVGEAAATTGARAFAAALTATGIGALVVGLGLAVNALMDFFDSSKDAKDATDALNRSLESQNQILDLNAKDLKRRQDLNIATLRAGGATEKQIRDQQLKDAQETYDAASAARIQAAKDYNANLGKVDAEGLKKLSDNLTQKEQAEKDALNAGKILRQNNIAADKKDQETAGQKSLARAQKLSQDILNQKKDAIAQYKEALDTQIQLEVDAEETSAEKLKPLIDKKIKAENDELDKAVEKLKEQKRDKIITEEQFNTITAGIEAKRAAIVLKYKGVVDKALEEDKKKKDDKKKELEEEIKNAEDFERRIAEIRINAIVDTIQREKESRTKKYNEELADLEKDKNFIKLSEEQKAEIRKALKTSLETDIAAIDKKAKEDQKAKDQKDFDDRLRLLELQGQSLLAGTTAYFENRKNILDTTMAKELAGLVKGSEEYLAVKKKYDKLYEQLDQDKLAATGKVISATLDAFAGLGNAIAGSYDEEAKTSEAAFNKRKQLQKATAIMSAASGIVQILTQPSTLPSPFDWIVKGINAAALGISTAINIKKIDQTKFEAPSAGGGTGASGTSSSAPAPINVVATRASGGIITGPGTATSDSIPARLSNGEYVVNARATSRFLPLLNSINDAGLQPRFAMGGLYKDTNSGYNVAENITNAITSSFNDRPIKTYVVGKDMSNQQQMDRTIKSRSLI